MEAKITSANNKSRLPKGSWCKQKKGKVKRNG